MRFRNGLRAGVGRVLAGGALAVAGLAGCQSEAPVENGAAPSPSVPGPASPSPADAAVCPAVGSELPLLTRAVAEPHVGQQVSICLPDESAPTTSELRELDVDLYSSDGVTLPASVEYEPEPDVPPLKCWEATAGTVSLFVDGRWHLARNAECEDQNVPLTQIRE
ncbi:MAG: hypothetical protein LBG60_08945 [Bifidobacteriaceae bacterium]|jgi:hypothetical protein|nr:hypothetical protein [Bifidobacteriaceae bacterium]